MILEVAILDVKRGYENEFELAFEKAQKIISSIYPFYLKMRVSVGIKNAFSTGC